MDFFDESLSLSKQLISTIAKNENLVFSPLSIKIGLSLIAAGSSGPTQNQLLGFLKSGSIEELNSLSSKIVTMLSDDAAPPLGGPTLSFVNSLWTCLELKPTFKQIVNHTYKAKTDHVGGFSDAVRQEVNAWAEKKTNGLIKEILPPGLVDAYTRLIFANALYFKGTWKQKFDATKTKDDEFFLLGGSSIQVPYMTSKEKQYIRKFDGFKVLKLPYKQGLDKRRSFSMLIYLPDDKDGLSSMIENVNPQIHLPSNFKVEVGDFRIPKFKIDFGFKGSNVLKELGLVLPFVEGGLTEMVLDSDEGIQGKKLFVDDIYHKSFIEVNEEGTEAAAVTAVRFRLLSLWDDEKVDFVADHPFLFVIMEDSTRMVLFVGQVHKPECIASYIT